MFRLMMRGFKKKEKGFTLIELVIVIAIIGILAAVLIPKFSGFTDKAKSTEVLGQAKNIATAIDSLLAEEDTTYTTANVLDLAFGTGHGYTGTLIIDNDGATPDTTTQLGGFRWTNNNFSYGRPSTNSKLGSVASDYDPDGK